MAERPEPPEPAWRTPSRPASTRRPLSRDAIVDAALRVLERDGAEGFSMRRVASELGTGAGALYWHVANKEELLLLAFDRVVDDVRLPEPDPARWKEQLRDVGWEMLRLMRAHRGIARISLGRIPVGPNLVRFAEWLLVLLRGAGIPDRAAALAGDLLGLYVGAFAYEESLGVASPDGRDRPVEEVVAMIGGYFASLPPEQFPNITALTGELMGGGPDERFAFGMDVIIEGLAAQREPPDDRG
jgi:AcrR family transcriptional regulator